MTKEEAMERIKVRFDKWALDNEDTEAIQTLIPELTESEDERTIKKLQEYVKNRNWTLSGPTQSEVLAWLEKQKDASKAIEAVDRIDKYIDEHLANAHDMKDSNPDKKYYRGWDDALGKMAGILQDVYSGEKQKEQRNYRKLYEDIAKSEWFKKTYEGKSLGGDDEQKPAEWDDYTKTNLDRAIQIIKKAKGKLQGYQTDDGIYECDKAIEALEHFLYRGLEIEKSAEWDKLHADFRNINEAFEDGKKEVVAHPEKYGLCRPTEWSEEDEKIAKEIEEELWYPGDFPDYPSKEESELYDDCQRRLNWFKNKLKSLRPVKQEWSEEDERNRDRALFYTRYYQRTNGNTDGSKECIDWLKSLSSNLKKRNEDIAKLCSNEWSEEDKKKISKLKTFIAQEWFNKENRRKALDMIDALSPQPKQEWSEEDEKIRQSIIKDIEFERNYSLATRGTVIGKFDEQINWLKFLRPQITNSTPLYTIEQVDEKIREAQEWSEEDESQLDDIEKAISNYYDLNHAPQYHYWLEQKLKSLRPPQYCENCKLKRSVENWKPSEEQMNALEEVRAIFHHHHLWDEINPILYDYEELMRDLQKLL